MRTKSQTRGSSRQQRLRVSVSDCCSRVLVRVLQLKGTNTHSISLSFSPSGQYLDPSVKAPIVGHDYRKDGTPQNAYVDLINDGPSGMSSNPYVDLLGKDDKVVSAHSDMSAPRTRAENHYSEPPSLSGENLYGPAPQAPSRPSLAPGNPGNLSRSHFHESAYLEPLQQLTNEYAERLFASTSNTYLEIGADPSTQRTTKNPLYQEHHF